MQVTGKAGTEPPQAEKKGQRARGDAGEPLGRPARWDEEGNVLRDAHGLRS